MEPDTNTNTEDTMNTTPTNPTTSEAVVKLAQYLRDQCGYEGLDTDLAYEYTAEAVAWHGGDLDALSAEDPEGVEAPWIVAIALSPEYALWIGGAK